VSISSHRHDVARSRQRRRCVHEECSAATADVSEAPSQSPTRCCSVRRQRRAVCRHRRRRRSRRRWRPGRPAPRATRPHAAAGPPATSGSMPTCDCCRRRRRRHPTTAAPQQVRFNLILLASLIHISAKSVPQATPVCTPVR